MFYFVRHSEPHLRLAFRSTYSFSVQSHFFILCSGPLSVYYYYYYYYYYYFLEFRVAVLVRHSESSCLSFVRSIAISSVLAFRAIGHTPSGLLSHFFSLVLAFRAVCDSHSGILSRFFPLVSAFRATNLFGIQCRYFFSLFLTFRVVVHTHSCILGHHILSSRWRSESFLLGRIIQGHGPQHLYSLTLRIWFSWF